MSAIKKAELEKLEEERGLGEDGLTYQQRCSRMSAMLKGKTWQKPETKIKKETGESHETVARPSIQDRPSYRTSTKPRTTSVKDHPLYGTRILITPLMTPDAKRNLAFDEPLGPELVVRDVDAGEKIYGQPEQVQQMVGDYEIVSVDKARQVIGKTTFPKIGTEISYCIGKELVPVVRGNSGERGYIWAFPTQTVQVDDTLIQLYGLKTLITNIFPELLEKFSGKPLMSYIDGITLAANIPMTEALIKEQSRKELLNARAGLEY